MMKMQKSVLIVCIITDAKKTNVSFAMKKKLKYLDMDIVGTLFVSDLVF